MLSNALTKLRVIQPLDPITLLYFLGVLTVSFDIFLVINLGFNFRFAQIAWGIPIAAAFLLVLVNRRFVLPLGFGALWLWFLFIVAFIPNAGLLSRGIGYAFWLGYNIALILATCYLFGRADKLLALVKWYLASYLFLAVFGLYQFLAPFLHLPAAFVVQWWPGQIARINGFSYEPSYYASYMLIGWVCSAYLLKKRSPLFDLRFLRAVHFATTLALILSSSRMGWIMMAVWYMHYPIAFLVKLFRRRLSLPYLRASAGLLGLAMIAGLVIVMLVGVEKVSFLLNGLGLGGASAHSSGTRLRELSDTLTVFLESPWLGYSLGGISTAIGALRGVPITNLELAKYNQGMSIFAETLAASGILGFIPFVVYIVLLLWAPLRRAATLTDRPYADLLRALVLALAFELVILQFNQNILRLYLWLHIAILSAAFAAARPGLRTSLGAADASPEEKGAGA